MWWLVAMVALNAAGPLIAVATVFYLGKPGLYVVSRGSLFACITPSLLLTPLVSIVYGAARSATLNFYIWCGLVTLAFTLVLGGLMWGRIEALLVFAKAQWSYSDVIVAVESIQRFYVKHRPKRSFWFSMRMEIAAEAQLRLFVNISGQRLLEFGYHDAHGDIQVSFLGAIAALCGTDYQVEERRIKTIRFDYVASRRQWSAFPIYM